MKAKFYLFFLIISFKLFSMEKIAIKDMTVEEFDHYFETIDPGSPRFNDAIKRKREKEGLPTGNIIEVEVAKQQPVKEIKQPVQEIVTQPVQLDKKVHFSPDTKTVSIEESLTPRYSEPPPSNPLESNPKSSLPDTIEKNDSFLKYFENKKTVLVLGLIALECADFGWTYRKIAGTSQWKTANFKEKVRLLLKNSKQAQLLQFLRNQFA